MRQSSPHVTIDIGSIRGFSTDEVTSNWLVDMDERYSPIFTVEIPLDLIDITTSTVLRQSSSPSLVFEPCDDEIVRGVVPDMYVRDALRASGEMETRVDSLSRSVHAADLDVTTVIDVLQARTDVHETHLNALKHDFCGSEFSAQLNANAATQASQLLKTNIRRHEREHVRCLLDPTTAIWREVELHQRSVALTSDPRKWNDMHFIDEFATLYVIPNCHMAEVLAMLTEDYTSADPSVQEAVEFYVAAQNDTQAEFLRFIERHDIDTGALMETLRSPIGELYCDFWLAYVIDQIRAGVSVDEIDADGFRSRCNPPIDSIGQQAFDEPTREIFVDYVSDRWKGPVAEFVCLTFTDNTFVLKRSWISMNPSASDAESLLAVRRALFRRKFLSHFVAESGMDAVLEDRVPLVEDVLWGRSLADVSLFRRSSPPPGYLSDRLKPAHNSTRDMLLGSQATTDDLNAWFNDPEYGYKK